MIRDTPKPAKESPVAEVVHTEPILSKANVVPEPLPEKEFMSGASKDGFVKPPKCVGAGVFDECSRMCSPMNHSPTGRVPFKPTVRRFIRRRR